MTRWFDQLEDTDDVKSGSAKPKGVENPIRRQKTTFGQASLPISADLDREDLVKKFLENTKQGRDAYQGLGRLSSIMTHTENSVSQDQVVLK